MDPYLFVDQTTCHATVDSSDDLYLLVFRGNTQAPFHSSMSVVRPNAFNDFDEGDSRGNDIQLARYFDNRVFVVALLERDADNDLLDNNARVLDLVRTQAHVAWTTHLGAQLLGGNDDLDAEDREQAAGRVVARTWTPTKTHTACVLPVCSHVRVECPFAMQWGSDTG